MKKSIRLIALLCVLLINVHFVTASAEEQTDIPGLTVLTLPTADYKAFYSDEITYQTAMALRSYYIGIHTYHTDFFRKYGITH